MFGVDSTATALYNQIRFSASLLQWQRCRNNLPNNPEEYIPYNRDAFVEAIIEWGWFETDTVLRESRISVDSAGKLARILNRSNSLRIRVRPDISL